MFENNADVYNYKNKNIDLKSNNAVMMPTY